MKQDEFVRQLDEARIVKAIAEAELRSSGEVRLFVTRQKPAEVLPAAQAQFAKLGMAKTAERNGVLLFFAPASRQFAIVGDAGVHARCGQDFWHEIRDGMSGKLKQGQYTEAIVEAIGKVGDVLARHFPRQKDDRNELPDDIARD